MAHYPQSATGLDYITYPAGPDSFGANLTGGGSSNTKGTYVEFVDSSPFASNYVEIHASNGGGTSGRQFAADLATGAAASETVVVPNMLSDSVSNSSHTAAGCWDLPLAIEASTRVAMRVGVNSTSDNTLRFSVTLIAAGATPGPTAYVNYGYDATDSGGVQVDPGADANTKGAYSELTSSTSAVAQVLCLNLTYKANTGGTSCFWGVDVATGAAASETVLIPDVRFNHGFTSSSTRPTGMHNRARTFLTYIAASTRIAARASCDLTDATDRLIDVAVLTATAPAESGGGGVGRLIGGGLISA